MDCDQEFTGCNSNSLFLMVFKSDGSTDSETALCIEESVIMMRLIRSAE